ncbi:hypothetical protein TDIS_0699 [Thermosulfurimonas dismutans]|uniref:TonB C-terminal domain-containing protein n=1 Tax=Thermosulfurimonas dismutans TaxID=999894 RepID=A0A179D797_9BACT|nr:hypothetical protein TDIS_0699 [Thermosulfurimonas dismutans]
MIIHVFLLGLFSLQFPERKKPSLVKVRLVSVSRASLHTSTSSSSPARSTKKKQIKTHSLPKRRTSKPKKKKSRSQPKHRKAVSSKPRPSRGKNKLSKAKKASQTKKTSSPPQPEVTPQEESLLEERLAALQLRKRLENLKKEVASKEKEVKGTEAQSFPPQDYIDLVKAHLDRFFEVPLTLKSQKNLAATVEIRLKPDGKLLSYRLLKSSGNLLLDRMVEAAVRAADPYPPPGRPITIKAIFTPEGLNF